MSTVFEKRLATLAQAQYDKYRWLRENQDPLASQVKADWTDLGLAFPNVAQPGSACLCHGASSRRAPRRRNSCSRRSTRSL